MQWEEVEKIRLEFNREVLRKLIEDGLAEESHAARIENVIPGDPDGRGFFIVVYSQTPSKLFLESEYKGARVHVVKSISETPEELGMKKKPKAAQ